MKPKHVVVVDALWVGHHPIYVKTFARVLLGAGYQVSVLCPAPGEVSLWVSQNVSAGVDRFKAYDYCDRAPASFAFLSRRLRHALLPLMRWMQISRAVKILLNSSGEIDLVFFAWLDSYVGGYLPVKLVDQQFPFVWSGLYFHPGHLRVLGEDGNPRKGWFALPENFLAKSKWASSVAVLDSGVLHVLRTGLSGKPVVALPDFTDEVPPSNHSELTDSITLKAKGRKIIALLGGLARRKGLLTLIRVVKQAAEQDWYFVVAGPLLDQTFSKAELAEIREFFQAQRGDCFAYLDKIQDDAEFNAVIQASDVLFAVYENFLHSSNLITKAAIYRKRILVNSGGYMEEVVRRFKLGESVPAGDVESAISSLRRLTRMELSSEESAGMQEYAREQSQAKLRDVMLDLVERATAGSSSNRTLSGSVQAKICTGVS